MEMAGDLMNQPEVAAPPEHGYFYSSRFRDKFFEYQFVVLSEHMKDRLEKLAKNQLLSITDLRLWGVIVEPGWQHSFIWRPPRQPPVIFLRRSLGLPKETMSLAVEPIPPHYPNLLDAAQESYDLGAQMTQDSPQSRQDRQGIAAVLDIFERITKPPVINDKN